MPPRTQYTKSGNVSVAYQVLGDGPIDLVFAQGWLSNVEYAWESPHYARFIARLAAFSRLIRFDRRGMGMSDRDVGHSTLEERVDDIRAVMDAVGSERAALLGVSEAAACARCLQRPIRSAPRRSCYTALLPAVSGLRIILGEQRK